MAPKLSSTPQYSLTIFISLSILFFLGLVSFISINNTRNISSSSSSSSSLIFINRKALSTSLDFTAFQGHHRSRNLPPPDPTDSEIDPRYGVEKRRVPTGPNPLHH